MNKSSDEAGLQREYYAKTARRYDDMHLDSDDEHNFALSFLSSVLDYFEIQSVLDIGSGTGRAIHYLKKRKPELRIIGIEPVLELRQVGWRSGLSQHELILGDAMKLDFLDGEFDLVCEFGVLHHIRGHAQAVSEMLRVARKAIFISDSNNFGQGRTVTRVVKQLIDLFGFWPVVDFIKTRGKGYTVTKGDGLAYSYSVFNDYKLIEEDCSTVHILNTKGGRINPYRTASHVALLGVK